MNLKQMFPKKCSFGGSSATAVGLRLLLRPSYSVCIGSLSRLLQLAQTHHNHLHLLFKVQLYQYDTFQPQNDISVTPARYG